MPILSTRGAASSKGFGLLSGGGFQIIISSDTVDYNLYNAAIAAGWPGTPDVNLNVTLNPGVFISSSAPGTTAFDVGSPWPVGSTITFKNNGIVVGRGGNGGDGSFATGPGQPSATAGGGGSNAIVTTRPINIINNNRIAGGGGGGGGGGAHPAGKSYQRYGGGGGGGIGNSLGGLANTTIPAPVAPTQTGATPGGDGNLTSAGTGGTATTATSNFGGPGGPGGGYGSSGVAGTNSSPNPGSELYIGAPGGATGAAIIGYSYTTITGAGQINGPTSG